MATWGDINAKLNRLVREGVISAFKTNLADGGKNGTPKVSVSPTDTVDEAGAKALFERVFGELQPVAEDIQVTVERG